ncbi:hypothetical protein PENARI_c016G06813 [Penicillium arizonense]|uniref:Uncharacterized protein n=1 Tax=Penicillium arizonense TaxID=1835702 RepID=A0A1F5LBZ9_PENAI|nr:hypothetical protein PENARI_c016G06813 [Penicillium arizonense]OGE50510.1 hypothetical protein PENARI_c016G06813 [Penicillium arizonense]
MPTTTLFKQLNGVHHVRSFPANNWGPRSRRHWTADSLILKEAVFNVVIVAKDFPGSEDPLYTSTW